MHFDNRLKPFRVSNTVMGVKPSQVADLLAGKRTTTKTVVTGEQVYTFTAENQPFRAMVELLARRYARAPAHAEK